MKLTLKFKTTLVLVALVILGLGTFTLIKMNAFPKELLLVSPKDYELGKNLQEKEVRDGIYYVYNKPESEITSLSTKMDELVLNLSSEIPPSKFLILDWNAQEVNDSYFNFDVIINIDDEDYLYSYVYDINTQEELDVTTFFTYDAIIKYQIANNGHLKLFENKIKLGDALVEDDVIEEVIKIDYGQYKPKPKDLADRKLLAFTFDDGPSAKFTQDIMTSAEKHNAKITFFALGSEIKKYPDVAKDIIARGHQLASHSYNHPKLTELSKDDQVYQITETENLIKNIAGHDRKVMVRPPYGAYDQGLLSNVPRMYVNWSVDTLDWKSRNAQSVCDAIMKDAKAGGIVLMHDIYETTAQGFACAIDKLAKEDYEFVTVETLFTEYGMDFTDGKIYNKGVKK